MMEEYIILSLLFSDESETISINLLSHEVSMADDDERFE
jgi:hypothetical protein